MGTDPKPAVGVGGEATLTEALIKVLAYRRACGDASVCVADDVSAEFFAAVSKPSAQPRQPQSVRRQPERPARTGRADPATSGAPAPAHVPPVPPAKRRFGRPLAPPQGNAAAAPGPASALPPPAPVADDLPAVSELDWAPLWERVTTCQRCPLARGRTQTVFGEGNTNAALMFIGEAPGFQEDQTGRPFVGPAGQLLTKMIGAMQFRREEVYIANICKCRPPGNRDPEDTEGQTCLPYLKRQIQLVKPEVIVLLGRIALRFLLGLDGITRHRGSWHEFEGIPVLPTFHPSYLLKNKDQKGVVWEDLKDVMQRLGKDPEETIRRMKTPS